MITTLITPLITMNELTLAEYNKIDRFISSNKSSNNNEFSISCDDLDRGKNMYNNLKNVSEPKQHINFGSDSCCYTVYSLYRSLSGKIYVLTLSMNKITNYIEILDDTWFNY